MPRYWLYCASGWENIQIWRAICCVKIVKIFDEQSGIKFYVWLFIVKRLGQVFWLCFELFCKFYISALREGAINLWATREQIFYHRPGVKRRIDFEANFVMNFASSFPRDGITDFIHPIRNKKKHKKYNKEISQGTHHNIAKKKKKNYIQKSIISTFKLNKNPIYLTKWKFGSLNLYKI